jgi:hypothetical protein
MNISKLWRNDDCPLLIHQTPIGDVKSILDNGVQPHSKSAYCSCGVILATLFPSSRPPPASDIEFYSLKWIPSLNVGDGLLATIVLDKSLVNDNLLLYLHDSSTLRRRRRVKSSLGKNKKIKRLFRKSLPRLNSQCKISQGNAPQVVFYESIPPDKVLQVWIHPQAHDMLEIPHHNKIIVAPT